MHANIIHSDSTPFVRREEGSIIMGCVLGYHC